MSLFCEEIIPFFHTNKSIEKIRTKWELKLDQSNQNCIEKEKKALDEVDNVYLEIKSTFANATSEEIQNALHDIEQEKLWNNSNVPLYDRMYDKIKYFLYSLLGTPYLDFCKKYCILTKDNTEIKEFTFAPTVLEADKAAQVMTYKNQPNSPSIIWYNFKEAHNYWHLEESYFNNPDNFKNGIDRLDLKGRWEEISTSKPENVSKSTQYPKHKFTKNFFIDGLNTLVTDIYKNL